MAPSGSGRGAEPQVLWSGWTGLGVVVQAYQKRGLAVIEALRALAESSGRRIMVRLVKGAYWDTEIKRAQERGLADYPVFTRKAMTDHDAVLADCLGDAGPDILPLIEDKRGREPLEDLRIDFEDGYGSRADTEEDAATADASAALARAPLTSSAPRPGRAKMVSITTAPPSSAPNCRPTTVTTGISAFFRACFITTW